MDTQATAPEDDDHRTQPPAMTIIGRLAHHGNDLLDSRRVCWIAHPLVTWRTASVVAG
jgi:hypothetical protein